MRECTIRGVHVLIYCTAGVYRIGVFTTKQKDENFARDEMWLSCVLNVIGARCGAWLVLA